MENILYEALVAAFIALVFGLGQIIFGKNQDQQKRKKEERCGFLKTYDTLAETPIKFHKFNHYFFLPLRFLALIFVLSDSIVNLKSLDTAGILFSFVATVVSCILIVIAFVGFFKWTTASLYALFAYFILDIISATYTLMLYMRYLPENIVTSLGRFSGTTTVAILICIYYWKRRNLFLHKPQTAPTLSVAPSESVFVPPIVAASPVQSHHEESPSAPESTETCGSIKFCKKCGSRLLPESVFCSYCGTKIM